MSNAYEQLLAALEPEESDEAILFGDWGWTGYGEPEPPPVPEEMKGKPLTLEEAKPMMQSWSFVGGYGAPECYTVAVYTNNRIGYVSEYDGSTCLGWYSRHPEVGVKPHFG